MVTGASAGIGRDLCLDLAKSGCKIVAVAKRIDRLKSLCDEINTKWAAVDTSIRTVAVELDVNANGSQIKSWILKAWDVFGRINVLVNNVGVRGNMFIVDAGATLPGVPIFSSL
ncbi:hypothetical protein IFM89_016374 [Coptis chinensis]|uniref:Uncharacterized protein n=1 Tax=Coptis chinensis TaxID=261450 RepID=A0A835LIV9_9MAGN|nr:hypothetical protein IFM89_016374 [Coptis chinensis]